MHENRDFRRCFTSPGKFSPWDTITLHTVDIDSVNDKDYSDGGPMMVFELHQIVIWSDHIRRIELPGSAPGHGGSLSVNHMLRFMGNKDSSGTRVTQINIPVTTVNNPADVPQWTRSSESHCGTTVMHSGFTIQNTRVREYSSPHRYTQAHRS